MGGTSSSSEDDAPTRSGRIGESSTDVSLREYIEVRLQAERELTQQQFQALKEATDKVADASAERFASVNEFRGQLSDQQKTLLTRVEYDSAHADVVRRIDLNTDQINELRRVSANYAGRIAAYGSLFALLVLGVTIALHFIK